jgi:hypothetical protein
MFRLLAFVLPPGVDSFAIAAALGAAGLTGTRERLRVSLIFVVFEAGMPLVGLAAGAGIARAVGGVADYLAGAAVVVLGIYMPHHRAAARPVSEVFPRQGAAVARVPLRRDWEQSLKRRVQVAGRQR